jgi:hypothetical protein
MLIKHFLCCILIVTSFLCSGCADQTPRGDFDLLRLGDAPVSKIAKQYAYINNEEVTKRSLLKFLNENIDKRSDLASELNRLGFVCKIEYSVCEYDGYFSYKYNYPPTKEESGMRKIEFKVNYKTDPLLIEVVNKETKKS